MKLCCTVNVMVSVLRGHCLDGCDRETGAVSLFEHLFRLGQFQRI